MSRVVPLIRAAALVPMVRWMQANGRPVQARLAAADLAYLPLDDPDRPIPVLSAAAFFRDAGRAEGPDIGCRVVSATSVLELAMLGKVALGARTPREALARVAAALPHHCTHEHISIEAAPVGILVREKWSLPFDPEVLHLVQQFVAAMIRVLCALTGARDTLLAGVEMIPHPTAGLDHLRPWFGAALAPAKDCSLTLRIDAAVADRPFRSVARDRMTGTPPPDWRTLRGDGSLGGSAQVVVAAMLQEGMPTAERLAAAAGLSLRSMQRRLAEEGTSFTTLLEGVRREAALKRITTAGGSLTNVSAGLGYARQSALTRAVRRWTGRPPSHLRQASGE